MTLFRHVFFLAGACAWFMTNSISVQANTAVSVPSASIDDEEFQHPPSRELAAELDGLMFDLGNVLYTTRKEATQRLQEIGAPALPHLRQAYRETSDLEVRMLIEETVLRLYLDYHVYNRNGFLGVSLSPYNPHDDRQQGPVVPEGTVGVYLSLITEGTAADRAGLQKGDVIILINGEPVQGRGRELTETVAAQVRAHRPGTTMATTVIRGDQTLEIDVVMGRCTPEQMRNNRRIIAIPKLLEDAKGQFPDWWVRNFRSSANGRSRGDSS